MVCNGGCEVIDSNGFQRRRTRIFVLAVSGTTPRPSVHFAIGFDRDGTVGLFICYGNRNYERQIAKEDGSPWMECQNHQANNKTNDTGQKTDHAV